MSRHASIDIEAAGAKLLRRWSVIPVQTKTEKAATMAAPAVVLEVFLEPLIVGGVS